MTEPVVFCPCCGHNLEADRPFSIGPLRVDPRGDLTWDGRSVGLTPTEHIILSTVASARGALASASVLQDRVGYDGDGNIIAVYLSRIRDKLRAAGAPPALIVNACGRGWRLDLEQLAANDAAAAPGDLPCR